MFLQTSFRPPPVANTRAIPLELNCELQQKRPSLKRKLLLENIEGGGEARNNNVNVWFETTESLAPLPLSDNDNSNWVSRKELIF